MTDLFNKDRAASMSHADPARNAFSLNPKPDIMQQLKEVWGDRVFSMKEVRTMREAELEKEEG